MQPTVKTTSAGGGMEDLKKRLAQISKAQVYVGVPEDKTARPDGDKTMTNAGLVYVHTNGSELAGLPPRPIIEPAIEEPDNREPIMRELRNAARSTLDERPEEAVRDLNLAGTLAANAAIRWFTDPRNGWKENAEETVKRKGSDRPLIDTAEMRGALTYLVEE